MPDDRFARSLAQQLIVPAAGAGAIAVFAGFQADRDGAPETALLGLLSFVALAALAALPGATLPLRLTALATVAVTLAAPAGPARGLAITVLLAVALAAGLLAATRRSRPDAPDTGAWIPVAVALQALAHPRLLPPAMDGGTALLTLILDWLVLPAICGAAAASLAARHGRAIAGVAGGVTLVLGGGWTWFGAVALAALVPLGLARKPAATDGRVARIAAGLTLGAVLATVIAAGYPWLSPTPLRTALAGLAGLPHPIEAALAEPVVVDAAMPDWHLDLEPRAARAILFDTYLIGGGDLAPGTPVALLGVELSGGEVLRRELRVARGSDDDPAGPEAPVPRVHHLAGDGRTFVGRSRTRIAVRDAGRVTQLTLERVAEAPVGLQIVIWWAGCER